MEYSSSSTKEQSFVLMMNKTFLAIHIMFFLLFTSIGVNLMAGVNMISICFYLLGFNIAKFKKINIYLYLVAVEVLIHMVLAVISVGMECNFQLFLIDVMYYFFLLDYVIKRKKKKSYSAIILSCIYSITIILLYTFEDMVNPIYKLDPMVTRCLSIAIVSIVLFSIIITRLVLSNFLASTEGAMEKKAQFDALTDLPNRFYMMAQLKNLFETNSQGGYYLAMIDIDDFKKINDTYGHNVGDDALKILSRTIVEKARGTELKYCRWGGEEFLLLGKCVNGEVPKDYLDEIRIAINDKTIWTSLGSGKMTVTIGAGKYKVGQDYKEWISFADKQLYVGKCTGKNKVVC